MGKRSAPTEPRPVWTDDVDGTTNTTSSATYTNRKGKKTRNTVDNLDADRELVEIRPPKSQQQMGHRREAERESLEIAASR